MGRFFGQQRRRSEPHRKRRRDEPQGSATPDDSLDEAQGESEEMEAARQRQGEEHRAQQAAMEQEIAGLDAHIDSVLSKNSEEFLKAARQPGGQ